MKPGSPFLELQKKGGWLNPEFSDDSNPNPNPNPNVGSGREYIQLSLDFTVKPGNGTTLECIEIMDFLW
jgi:hypothetical protein